MNQRVSILRNLHPQPCGLCGARRFGVRAALWAGLGVAISLASVTDAKAGDILRGGTSIGAKSGRVAGQTNPLAAGPAATNARDTLARTTQAIKSVQAMQSAARSAALKGPNNLGLNPNQPGRLLPNVPNGLMRGGLHVAPGVPVNLAKPVDGEDPKLWQGAKLPQQTTADGRTTVTIEQTKQQAILNWRTFNIGKETTLRFDQERGGTSKGQWIAFNKVNDPSGIPSQILGSIEAPGHVYVINANGIIFGGSSQINLRTLVASSLPINDNLIQLGLLNNRDAQFLFSGLEVPGGADGTPNFVPGPPPASTGRFGDVVVQPGAILNSVPSGDGNGGRIMLVGANVFNAGTLSASAGQTILAAGLQVGMSAHASDDPSLRGLDVFVGAIAEPPPPPPEPVEGQAPPTPPAPKPAYAGTATNSGLIDAPRANVTLAGKSVNQLGAIESTTSVDLNGRIDIRASYGAVANPNYDNKTGEGAGGPPFLYQKTGVVTFGSGSVTRILPDYESPRTVPGTSLPEKSQINVEGLVIHLGENAMMLAPNADVTIRAGVWPYQDVDGNRTVLKADGSNDLRLPSFFSGPNQTFLLSGGQIYLDNSSLIDVAGSTEVFVPLANSILDVEFRGSEFADSPLQREGPLRATPLTVDLRRTGVNNGRYWMGTPLGDVTGLAGLIQRNAAQLTAAGGNVTLRAGGSIILQNGSTIDVSGGSFLHEGGMVETSRLLQGGRLVDIADAVPSQNYDGVFTGQFTETHGKWGVSKTYTVPFLTGEHFEESYIEGADGGTLVMSAASMAIDGELRGHTVQGLRERALPPGHSTLSIAFRSETSFEVDANNLKFLQVSPTPPDVTFARSAAQSPADTFQLIGEAPAPLRADRVASVILSPGLLEEQGFGNLSVENTDGNITVPSAIALTAPALGSVSLAGANITVRSDISAPGGTLKFTAYNISPAFAAEFPLANPQGALAPSPNASRGLFTLGTGASLSAAGLTIDERLDDSARLVIDGGAISIDAFSASLAAGSTIDVSGGVTVSTRGRASYGNAGTIAIRTGKDPGFGTVIGGELGLNSTFLGYSGARGGSLTLQASQIQIGGVAGSPNTLLLQPDFFRRGGFADYALIGIGAPSNQIPGPGDPETYAPAIAIAPGTLIAPVAENILAIPLTVGSEDVELRPMLRPVGQRSPASISFSALGSDDVFTLDVLEVRGDIVMGPGAQIFTDPGANVTFRGQSVTMLGSVTAPGGVITIGGASRFPLPADQTTSATFARPTVYIGPQTTLSTAGTTVLQPDAFDRRRGTLFPGGTILVSGNIVASSGAVLDVSGASATFDLHPSVVEDIGTPLVPMNSGVNAPLASLESVPMQMDSNGGRIDLQGSEMLFSDAKLIGNAGGSTAIGGTLSIFSGRFYPQTASRTSADINLIVTQSGRTIPFTTRELGIGLPVRNAAGAPLPAMGYFAADHAVRGGFDSLDLGFKFIDASPFAFGGNIEFRGPVSITVPGSLRVAAGGVIQANAPVTLTSAYAAIGQPFRPPLHPDDPFIPFQQNPANPSLQFFLSPTFGPGKLTVKADLIDIGTVSLQNVGRAQFIADGGDIRGNGTLSMAGDLHLRAGQIYPTTLSTFNLFAYDHSGVAGSIVITGSGSPAAPLSAGGNLNVFASKISQGGVLRAPLGSITIGWDGTDFDLADADLDAPFNPVTGSTIALPVSSQVRLQPGSLTSVAAMTGVTGAEMLIPFGLSPDGLSWIDPRGVNVTLSGLPEKRVSVAGENVVARFGSTIDIRGGGELSAFRFVAGTGGSVDLLGTASGEWNSGTEYEAGDLVTNRGQTWSARVQNSGQRPSASLFWSLVQESYAVLPGYQSGFAPYAPFNTSQNAGALAGDPGFVSSSLRLGEQIFLEGVPGLDDGTYTLLPRRYALLPGAFLVTPTRSEPIGAFALPDGASFASGFSLNEFNQPGQLPTLRSRFEVAPFEVVQARAQYDAYAGNAFFTEAATRFEVDQPQRLPIDSGYTAFHGNVGLKPNGAVLTSRPPEGRGASIDLSSFADIHVVGGGGVAPGGATAVLKTGVLNSWGAESLVVGGLRRSGADGTVLEVRTSNLTLNNPKNSFFGPEIILASKESLTLSTGSSIASTGVLSEAADNLRIVGDGTLLRVSSDFGANINRTGVTDSTDPLMTIGAGARIAGTSVILDSSYGTSLDSAAVLRAEALALGSGQISILLDSAAGGLAGSVVDPHLTIAGQLLEDVQQVSSLKLRSYRTIDVYGTGAFGSALLKNISLLAGGIRGFDQGDGTATFQASKVLFSNPSNVAALAAPAGVSGSLQIEASTILLGSNAFSVAGYGNVSLDAAAGVLGRGTGTFSTQDNLTITTPLITGAQGSTHGITAGGALVLEQSAGTAQVRGGLGASFTFTGTSVLANTNVVLPSGQITLHATAGDVTVGGVLNVDGTRQEFYDLIRYADAGSITLTSDAGDVDLLASSRVSVAAAEGGGNAGSVAVNAALGAFSINGATLLGTAEAGNTAGTFLLDVGTLPSFAEASGALNEGGFFENRNFRVRTGDITIANLDGRANVARNFTLSTDQGDIRVTGTVDASGVTGGEIVLVAGGNLILESGAVLTAHAETFSNAGKGGEIRLEAGAAFNGIPNVTAMLEVQSGSTIDLGVDTFIAGTYTTPGSSAFNGQFTGKLHLRAPRNGDDLNIGPIAGNIVGASSVLAEGYRIYDRTGIGTLDNALRGAINTDNTAFMTAGYDAMHAKLLSANPDAASLGSLLVIAPGVEIINRTGDLTLGTAADNAANDWNLSTFRYGPQAAPGVLTLRAAGDVNFLNALSDGFSGGVPGGTPAGQQLWLSRLMNVVDTLPVNTQSWSYRIATGADLGAADFQRVQSVEALDALGASMGAASPIGSLNLGKFYGANLVSGPDATTASAINNRFQVIRTGTGDIDIAAGRDVQLRNQFATIYTAGVRLTDPTTIFAPGDFARPIVERAGAFHPNQGALGAVQQVYPAQWSLAGGDVTLSAQGDIARVTLLNGEVIADTSRQLPTNWLYRRGYVDASTGLFGLGGVDPATPEAPFQAVNDPSASTTWWVDFSNFFQGIGALGGGNITLLAGDNITNADAAIPTNARMPGRAANPNFGQPGEPEFLNLAPDASKLVELGGGDLLVRAGNNLDGGSYYVERGKGRLFAGGSVTTNRARSPSLGILGATPLDPSVIESANPAVFDSRTWLPTTLFAGKSQFEVSARGDILLGPVINPFLVPQGLNNKFWNKTNFNTFAADAAISVSSFGGSVTHRLATTLPDGNAPVPILQAWINKQNLLADGNASNFEPWIRIAELDAGAFSTVLTVNAPTLRSTAFAGDVNIVGPLTLFPSPTGTIELAASGGVIGLQPSGRTLGGAPPSAVTAWTAASINLSDADPAAVPSSSSPLGYQSLVGRTLTALRDGLVGGTQVSPFTTVDPLFQETGSFAGPAGTIETKRALHSSGVLHSDDRDPARIYATGGDITGLTLFSPKAAQVFAQNDITDISFYIQNVGSGDISVVSAGRDIIPNNGNAPLRSLANDLAQGNIVVDELRSTVAGDSTSLLPGDIQISGPGVLEVLAGRNLDLGTGANLIDGTGVGITSIGNSRNPALPFPGADIIALAGVPGKNNAGPALGLANSSLDFASFITGFMPEGDTIDSAYVEDLGLTGTAASLTEEQQSIVALEVFFRQLRDAGRNFATTNSYDSGTAAITALFGAVERDGEVFTRARDIRTSTGGTISIGAPGGGLTLASDIFGNPLTPPGIVTEFGGPISIFTNQSVDIGQARIFTLRGGDIVIWSSLGDIAAGTAPKTVVTAPPTRVVIDVTSADVQTDLGGLATGGGIGVLASVEGVQPGNVDLIAPLGIVDAGDAGIRVSGNLNIAATQVLNAGNIAVSGASAGVPSSPTVAAPNIGGLAAASNTAGAATSAATEATRQSQAQPPQEELPSIITVEVLGYGGSGPSTEEEEEEERRKRREAEQSSAARASQVENTAS